MKILNEGIGVCNFFLRICWSILLIGLLASCKKQPEFHVDCYIGPRYPETGILDQGIFVHPLKKHSIRVAASEISYGTFIKRDSLFELFYLPAKLNAIQIGELYSCLQSGNGENWTIQAYFEVHVGSEIIEVQVDQSYNVLWNSRSYHMNKELILFFHGLMPLELRENWEKGYPFRVQVAVPVAF